MKPIEILENQYGVPTHSFFQAINCVKSRDCGLDEVEYRSRINQILGVHVDISDTREAEYTYYYVIQNLVKNHISSITESNKDLYARSHRQACGFIGSHHYCFAQDSVDQNGDLAPRKQTKQELAAQIFNDNKDSDKKIVIGLFMEKLNMSKAGATTYYYNLKKKDSE